MHVADDVHTCDIRNPPAACVTGGFLFFLVPKYSGFVPHCFHRLPSEFHRVSARLPPDFRAVPLPFHFRSACVPRCSVGVPQCSAGLPLTSTCFLKWFHMRAARITAACRQSSHAVGLRRAWSSKHFPIRRLQNIADCDGLVVGFSIILFCMRLRSR